MIVNHIILSDVGKEGTATFSGDRASQHQNQQLWILLYANKSITVILSGLKNYL